MKYGSCRSSVESPNSRFCKLWYLHSICKRLAHNHLIANKLKDKAEENQTHKFPRPVSHFLVILSFLLRTSLLMICMLLM